MAHLDQRDRERSEMIERTAFQNVNNNQTKPEEIVLLEKQGRCSQKLRNSLTSNLATVSQIVGQNMTDISNIGSDGGRIKVKVFFVKLIIFLKYILLILKEPEGAKNYGSICQSNTLQLPQSYSNKRGTSLPPSALPRAPRALKPPTKIQYDRLSDADIKSRSQTPPKIYLSYRDKMSEIGGSDYGKRDHTNNLMSVNESVEFSVRKDGRIKAKSEFSRPEFTSRRYYQRLEENPSSKLSLEPKIYKRSLLPKYSSSSPRLGNRKNARDSQNSSESTSTIRNSPVPLDPRNITPNYNLSERKTEPTYLLESNKTNSMTSKIIPSRPALATLPPKPSDSRIINNTRRGGSVSRGENRYRIQF